MQFSPIPPHGSLPSLKGQGLKTLQCMALTAAFALPLHGMAATDSRDDRCPWAIASGAEWAKEYPQFNPLLEQAGVRWMRYFAGWSSLQPKPDQWNWTGQDGFLENSRAHKIRISGLFVFFPKWASAAGDERTWPLKDMQLWRDYVTATVTRYHKDIKYWEVWNEFNGGGFFKNGTPKIYAEMVREASIAAKKVDPDCKIGLSCANFSVGFFDETIKAGAAGHFDFIAIHPYENLDAVMDTKDGEMGYLSLAPSIRKMLANNKEKADMPIWITEIGAKAPTAPEAKADAVQAEALVKAYMLSLPQGIAKVCWFEARGPSYGKGLDFGLIRKDWSVRPSHKALQVMTSLLGPEPQYLGWLKAGATGYGFLYKGKDSNVLCAWSAPESTNTVQFDSPVTVVDLTGKAQPLAQGQTLTLTRTPVFITGISPKTTAAAQSQLNKPFPWGVDYSKGREVYTRLGSTNLENGVKLFNPKGVAVVNMLEESCLQTSFDTPAGRYLCFRVDPSFAGYGDTELEVTITARRIAGNKPSGMKLLYENIEGYKGNGDWWTIPEGEQWHQKSWRLRQASFVGGWGYNFRTDSVGAANGFLIKEVRVKKLPAGSK